MERFHAPEQQTFQAAANWVRDYNVSRKLNAKYWEIGNECLWAMGNGNTSGSNYAGSFALFMIP